MTPEEMQEMVTEASLTALVNGWGVRIFTRDGKSIAEADPNIEFGHISVEV